MTGNHTDENMSIIDNGLLNRILEGLEMPALQIVYCWILDNQITGNGAVDTENAFRSRFTGKILQVLQYKYEASAPLVFPKRF